MNIDEKKKKLKEYFSNQLINDNDDPFQGDYSGNLKNFAKNLQNFIENKTKEKSFVISLEAPYGMGKTTFIDMFGHSLINQKKLVIKYDAWLEDISSEPLTSLLGTISEQVDIYFDKKNETAKSFSEKANNVIKKIPNALFHAAVNIVANQLGIGDSVNEIFGSDDTQKDNYIKDEIKNHIEKKAAINDFKEALKNLTKKRDGSYSTLFFFVDELDRCRPSFAFLLIEIIKHLFNVPHVCFILANNKKIFNEIFKNIYGGNFDSTEYLERPIDRYISLPEPEIDKYVLYKFNNFSSIERFKNNNHIGKCIVKNCYSFMFNLREIEKHLEAINDFIDVNKENNWQMPDDFLPAISYLMALKLKDENKFNQIKTENGSISSLVRGKISENTFLYWSLKYLHASKDELSLKDLNKEIQNIINKKNSSNYDSSDIVGYLNIKDNFSNLFPSNNHINYFERVMNTIHFMNYITQD